MLTHFYHVTGADKWRRIQTDDDYDGSWPGLRLGRPLVNPHADWLGLPDKAYAHVIHGFIDAEPQAWFTQDVEDKRTAFEVFLGHANDGTDTFATLKVQLHKDDDAWVIDQAPLKPIMALNFDLSDREAIARFSDFWNSRVRVQDYTGREGMELPEVISFSPIPLHRVQCIELKEKFQMVNRGRKNTDRVLTLPHRVNQRVLDDFLALKKGPGY